MIYGEKRSGHATPVAVSEPLSGSVVESVSEGLALLGLLRWIKYLPDRILHPFRRNAAQAAADKIGLPPSALFVCHGNIYRSPYAEYRFLTLLPNALRSRMEVSSGGFVGPGRGSPPNAITIAAGRGIDLVPHQSSLLTQERIDKSALIVVMEARQKTKIMQEYGAPAERIFVLGDLDPEAIERRTIRDPWKKPDSLLADSYARIDRCIAELVRRLPGAREGADVEPWHE
jgi:protein-tyrosine-phosphatase